MVNDLNQKEQLRNREAFSDMMTVNSETETMIDMNINTA